jgi:hypothetical protein
MWQTLDTVGLCSDWTSKQKKWYMYIGLIEYLTHVKTWGENDSMPVYMIKNFSSVSLYVWGSAIRYLCIAKIEMCPCPFKHWGCLSCHTCCDTGPRLLWYHPKCRPISSPDISTNLLVESMNCIVRNDLIRIADIYMGTKALWEWPSYKFLEIIFFRIRKVKKKSSNSRKSCWLDKTESHDVPRMNEYNV